MTNVTSNNGQTPIPGIDFVVTGEALVNADVNGILHDIRSVDCLDINRQLRDHLRHQRAEHKSATLLLEGITDYHMDPYDQRDPFKPVMVVGNHRTLIPTDLLSEQVDTLANFASYLDNCGLRARVADIVWYLNRNRTDVANLAVESYCDCVHKVQLGLATFAFDEQSPYSTPATDVMARAVNICYANQLTLPSSTRLEKIVLELVELAIELNARRDFARIAHLAISCNVAPLADLASQAETLAKNQINDTDSPSLEPDLWMIAARCYRREHNHKEANRCITKAAECRVRMANDIEDSPTLESSLLQEALRLYRQAPGTEGIQTSLRQRLSKVKVDIPDEMQSIVVKANFDRLQAASVQMVTAQKALPLPSALLTLARCYMPPSPDELQRRALYFINQSSLLRSMPVEVHDDHGRVVFQSIGYSGNKQQREKHLQYVMAMSRRSARSVVVHGAIQPMREAITSQHDVSIETIQGTIADSSFIPPGREDIFGIGISHFLHGDNLQAACLLIPQLENSLRHILACNGIDTTTSDDSGTQTEASLNALLNQDKPWRTHLEALIGPQYILEIDLLFNFAGGPAIRNKIAHGTLQTDIDSEDTVIFATWLILHLVMLSLVVKWTDFENSMPRGHGKTK